MFHVLVDPFVERLDRLRPKFGAIDQKDVREAITPVISELTSLEESVDHPFSLGRIFIGQKFLGFFQVWKSSNAIEEHPTEKLAVVRRR